MWNPFGKPERITSRPAEGIDERSLQPLFDAIETEEPQQTVDALLALAKLAPEYQSLRSALLRGIGKISARYTRPVPYEPLPPDTLPEHADAKRLAFLEFLDDSAVEADLSGQEALYYLQGILGRIVAEADQTESKEVVEKRLIELKEWYVRNTPRVVDFIHKNRKP